MDGADSEAQELQDWLRQSTGQVPWWGFTGPPGVGKSTLIDALLTMLRRRGKRVGVVAVDPTSPISDGALLGDRVRMMRHAVDPEVFIRSLATHRCDGGLSDAALHCARLLEVAGFDPVLIETVGVGQNEFDIASVADICVVVLGPGYGDDIQLIKAGLLEIADIVVVNKCDLPEANRLLKAVRAEMGGWVRSPGTRRWAVSPSEEHAYPGSAREGVLPGAEPDGPPVGIKIAAIEAQSGPGVEDLLGTLEELDLQARGAKQRRSHRHRRVVGEIKRYATLQYQRALERGLAAPGATELIASLERGDLSLDLVIAELTSQR